VGLLLLPAPLTWPPPQAYLIAMVWACYRYLLLRQAGGPLLAGDEADSTAALPDYEVALADPRFSKVDLANYPAPPPSYDAATSGAK